MRAFVGKLFPFFASCLACASAGDLTPEERAQGFERLFAGNEFPAQEWHCWEDTSVASTACGPAMGWGYFPGEDAFGKNQVAVEIGSRRTWRDFEARFDFRVRGNAAFYYRLAENAHEHPANNLGYWLSEIRTTTVRSGSLWDTYNTSPDTGRFHPHGEWHSARVVVAQDSIEHWLNGEKVAAFRIGSREFRARVAISARAVRPQYDSTLPLDGSHPLLKAGSIGWLGSWGDSLRVRNFRIAELPLRPTGLSGRTGGPPQFAAGSRPRPRGAGRIWFDFAGFPHDLRGRRAFPCETAPNSLAH